MVSRKRSLQAICSSIFLVCAACSSDAGDESTGPDGLLPGAGGGYAAGGSTASGGAPPGLGGSTAGGPGSLGGTPSAGGSTPIPSSGGAPAGNGGAPGTGNAPAAGGAIGSGGSEPGTGGTGGSASSSTLPPVTSVDQDGPFATTVDGMAGANSTVFRPTDLGKDGVKHPIFVWGTGATSVPSQYDFHMRRIASHGFVVISPNSASVNATLLKASLDWILAQNDAAGSVYAGKLATTKVAMGGHSLGSIGTFDAEATETRLTTTIHIAGGSFDGRGSSKVKTPTAYICGASGDIALPQCKVDFQNAGTNPTFYSELQGVGHVEAARNALPGMVAWLRWHLAGEVERKAMFSTGGQFFMGIWKSQTKNW